MAVLFCATLVAQEPVIKRSAPMTLTGEIVDISCYKSKGVAGGTGAAHVDCAKMCILQKDAAVGHPHRRRWPLQDLGHRRAEQVREGAAVHRSDGGNHRHRSHALEQLRRSFFRSADDQAENDEVGGYDDREVTRFRIGRRATAHHRRVAREHHRANRRHQQRCAAGAHLHERHRADHAALVSDVSPARHQRADVAAHLRGRAPVGARDQGQGDAAADAALAHRAERRHPAVQGRSVAERRRDCDDRGVGRRRRAARQPRRHAGAADVPGRRGVAYRHSPI